MNEYGDFEEIKEESKPVKEKTEKQKEQEQAQQQFTSRARLPRHGQLIGVVVQRLGGNRMSVKATDNKIRNCRVPGRFKRKFWLRSGDAVIIAPWPDNDDKADIVFQYKKGARFQLDKTKILDQIKNEF